MEQRLENFFKDASIEYEHIVHDLQNRLKKEVSDEIIAFVDFKTEEGMNRIIGIIHKRYEELHRLDELMAEEPTEEEKENFKKSFFNLTDPGKIANDFKRALSLDNLEADYLQFIKQMGTQAHGEIFNRYSYPPEFFAGLKRAVLYHIDGLTEALNQYAQSVGNHALILDSIHQGQKDHAIIKGSATALGLLVGIPFAGAGVGALLGGNDKSKVNDSLQKVFNKWEAYEKRYDNFVQSLNDNYRLALMTLYGGTLLRVNEQFKALHFMFSDMALLSGEYLLTLTPEEKYETEKWMRESTNKIRTLIKQKNWKEALFISNKLLQIMRQRPVTARTELYDNNSSLYIAHLHYYLAYQEALLEEYRNGHMDSFYKTVKNLYKELYLLVNSNHIPKGFSKTDHLLFRFVKEALKRENKEDLLVIADYMKRLEARTEKIGAFSGEITIFKSKDKMLKNFANDYKGFVMIEKFMEEALGLQIDSDEDDAPDVRLNRKQIKELRKIDAEIGVPDKLTKYLKGQYVKALLLPWLKDSLQFTLKYKKKIAAVAVAVFLLFFGYQYGDDIYKNGKAYISSIDLFSGNNKSNETEASGVTRLTITTEYGNVRSDPTLNSTIVYTASNTEELQYLNETKVDDEGREWYLIQVPNGEGWISSKITKNVE